MASHFLNWLCKVLDCLVCVKRRKANGRRTTASVVSASKYGWIFAADVESPSLLLPPLLLLLLLLLLRRRIAIAAAVFAVAAAVIASMRGRSDSFYTGIIARRYSSPYV